MDVKAGRVFVGEVYGDEAHIWSGRWCAHWESDDGKGWRQGPEGVSAADAIAWGRDEADVVLIRPGDSDILYSAGARDPETLPEDRQSSFPRWPVGRDLPRRREKGREYLDRSPEAPPILWRICGGADLVVSERFLSQYTASLRSDDAVVDVPVPARVREGSGFDYEFTVRAVTVDEARRVAIDVEASAFTAGMDAMRDLAGSVGVLTFMGDPEPVDRTSDRGT
jgi:hypothetical protein